MTIIIDAYNMLKQSLGAQYITEEQRKRFIDRLSAYARRKGHTVLVVFDGGPDLWPTEASQGLLDIIYAGQGSSADEIIKERLPALPAQDTVLVTSDRALRDYALRHSIVSLEPQVFSYYSKLEKSATKPRLVKDLSKPHKLEGHQSSSAVDALMEQAGRVIFYKDSEENELQKPQGEMNKGRKLSKLERKLAQVIGKL